MEEMIQKILSMNTIDASLKIVVVILLAAVGIFYRRWKVKQAGRETEEHKRKDIEDAQNNNQSVEVKTDSQASDDFLRRKK